MYEVEAKVPIKKSDVSKLRKQVKSFAVLKEKNTKKDTYYGWEGGIAVKIRENSSSANLILKIRSHRGKIEANTEIEIPIISSKKCARLLESSGFKISQKKEKHYEYFQYKNFQIEINFVPKLGYYLEIENNVKNKSDITKATKELHKMFKKLGYSPSDFEKRYYLDMLAEKLK